MANVLFYTHGKDDLEKVVRLVINEIRQTELIYSPIPIDDEKLTQTGASLLLGVSVTTIIEWRKSGKIPRDAYMRIGRPIFYSKKKLLEYAKNNKGFSKNSK